MCYLMFNCALEISLFMERFVCWMREVATILSKHSQNFV